MASRARLLSLRGDPLPQRECGSMELRREHADIGRTSHIFHWSRCPSKPGVRAGSNPEGASAEQCCAHPEESVERHKL